MIRQRAEFDAPGTTAARTRAGRRALLLLLLASPLAACGRRGRLELPPHVRGQAVVPPPVEEDYLE